MWSTYRVLKNCKTLSFKKTPFISQEELVSITFFPKEKGDQEVKILLDEAINRKKTNLKNVFKFKLVLSKNKYCIITITEEDKSCTISYLCHVLVFMYF